MSPSTPEPRGVQSTPAAAGPTQQSPRSRARALLVLLMLMLAVFSSLGLGRFGYAMILPAMREALHLSDAQTGQLQSWTSLGYVAVVAFVGMLAARVGPRLVIALSLALVGLSMLGTAAAPVFGAICVARLLTGVGSAGVNVPAMGMVSAWFRPQRRGLAAGVVVAGSSLGLVASGAAVPPLLERYPAAGWRVCWITFGVVALMVAAAAAALLRNRPERPAARTPPPQPADRDPAERTDRKNRATLLRLWESPYFRLLAAIYFAFGFSYIIYATFFVEHLVRDLGLTKAEAGTVWFRIGVGSVASGFIWGGVSDRFGRPLALMLIFAAQGFCYQIAGCGTSLTAAYVSGMLFALTAWSIPAVVAAASGDAFGPKLAPAVLGWLTVAFGLGQVAGPCLAGILADATGSLSAPFSLAGAVALAFGAGGATLLRPPTAAE